MKKLTLTLILTLICSVGFAQKIESFKIDSLQTQLRNATNDSLETQLRNATNDTTKAKLILEIIGNVGRGRGGVPRPVWSSPCASSANLFQHRTMCI